VTSVRPSALRHPDGGPAGHSSETVATALSHIAAALVAHDRRLQLEGTATPPMVADLTRLLLECVRVRHDATALYAVAMPVNDPDMSVPLLVTKREAARLLSVSMRTVERLIAAGRLPVVHVEGASRIRVDDLRTYVDRLTAELPTAGGRKAASGSESRQPEARSRQNRRDGGTQPDGSPASGTPAQANGHGIDGHRHRISASEQ
jgi:excisionase family DNA binding protein